MIVFLNCFGLVQAQSIQFEKNISLPDASELVTTYNLDFASPPLQLITANNKVFAYTFDKLLVLNTSGDKIIATIPFNGKYGKTIPVFDNSRKYVGDHSFMVTYYNNQENREDLFVVTPELEILKINTNTYSTETIYPTNGSNSTQGEDIDNLSPLHGQCLIKYDNNNKRLFWLMRGRQDIEGEPYLQNYTGQFHNRETYFAIFQADNNNSITSPPFYEFRDYSIENDLNHATYRNKNIVDFEINTNLPNNQNETFFYLAKLNRVEFWKITGVTTPSVGDEPFYTMNVDNSIYGYFNGNTEDPLFYKFSKLLYVNEPGGLHKLVALPYRYPSSDLQPGKTPEVYVIDCNAPGVEALPVPNKRVYDATYISQNGYKDLVMCFSADPDEQLTTIDLGIYNFDPSITNSYGDWLFLKQSFNTCDNTEAGIDVDSPKEIYNVGNDAVICKKDKVLMLSPTGSTYGISPLINNENNFFGNCALNNGDVFVSSLAGGKIERFTFSSGNWNSLSYPYAFQAYHIAGNHNGTIQVYYSKQNIDNLGFFVNNNQTNSCSNINHDLNNSNNFPYPVGDVVYNESKNEFLISANDDFSNQSSRVYRYSGINSIEPYIETKNQTIEVNYQNAKEMFIAPNGILYVMTNTKVGGISNPEKPVVLLYNSSDYSFIKAIELSMPPVIRESEFYMTHFCYSESDQKVYLSVTPQELTLVPYQSEYNSMVNGNSDDLRPSNNGRVFSINSSNQLDIELGTDTEPLVNPGKIICPDDGNDNVTSVFEGKVFVVSENLYTISTTDNDNDAITMFVNDIIYSPVHDRMFGLKDEHSSCADDRIAVVYEIIPSVINNTFELSPLPGNGFSYQGQVSSFFMSVDNNQLFLHTRFDNEKTGTDPSKLLSYNIHNNTPGETIELQGGTDLQNRSVYPEFDHCPDYKMYNYILTTPYFDQYNNKIYLPNGAHSNVSVVDIEEFLNLSEGTNWISIPRHTRFDDPNGNFTFIENVFDRDNFENPYNSFYSDYLFVNNSGNQLYEANWPSGYWVYIPEVSTAPTVNKVYSTRGYKVMVNSGYNENSISLSGILENPHTEIELYDHEENWIGYFLLESQDIFDAIADFEEDIFVVKGKDYFCYRGDPMDGGGLPQPVEPYAWFCDKLVHNISYGEMVILKTYKDIPDFRWSNSGITPEPIINEEPLYFSYTETSDYSALIIELDTTENPVELGAFINDSCVGACTLNANDSLAIIRGYLDSQPGDSVVFEEYFGTKSSVNSRIYDYYVFNDRKQVHEKRIIKSGENKEAYFISFRDKDTTSLDDLGDLVSVFPNPVNKQLTINYTLTVASAIEIAVFDAIGRKSITLLSANQPGGTYSVNWNLLGENNQKVNNGIYIVQIKINDNIINKKIVVN